MDAQELRFPDKGQQCFRRPGRPDLLRGARPAPAVTGGGVAGCRLRPVSVLLLGPVPFCLPTKKKTRQRKKPLRKTNLQQNINYIFRRFSRSWEVYVLSLTILLFLFFCRCPLPHPKSPAWIPSSFSHHLLLSCHSHSCPNLLPPSL